MWKETLDKAVKFIKSEVDFTPSVAIVLGSGIGDFANKIKIEKSLSYDKVEGLAVSTVKGHEGRFIFGYIGDVKVVAMQGRVHLYEGYSASDVVMPIRIMAMLGAKYFVVTNASGGITFPEPGTLMLIKDHISSFVKSPLIGKNYDEVGLRFPDMTHAYSTRLQALAKKVAKEQNVDLKEGVYVQFTGPQYETPAEINMARVIGADAVGMSTVIEVIAANHIGMEVVGISCITNPAAGIVDRPLRHEDVQAAADIAGENLAKLIYNLVLAIGEI